MAKNAEQKSTINAKPSGKPKGVIGENPLKKSTINPNTKPKGVIGENPLKKRAEEEAAEDVDNSLINNFNIVYRNCLNHQLLFAQALSNSDLRTCETNSESG